MCGPGGPGPWSHVKFLGGHGQFEDVLYEKIMDGSVCSKEELIDGKVKISDHC